MFDTPTRFVDVLCDSDGPQNFQVFHSEFDSVPHEKVETSRYRELLCELDAEHAEILRRLQSQIFTMNRDVVPAKPYQFSRSESTRTLLSDAASMPQPLPSSTCAQLLCAEIGNAQNCRGQQTVQACTRGCINLEEARLPRTSTEHSRCKEAPVERVGEVLTDDVMCMEDHDTVADAMNCTPTELLVLREGPANRDAPLEAPLVDEQPCTQMGLSVADENLNGVKRKRPSELGDAVVEPLDEALEPQPSEESCAPVDGISRTMTPGRRHGSASTIDVQEDFYLSGNGATPKRAADVQMVMNMLKNKKAKFGAGDSERTYLQRWCAKLVRSKKFEAAVMVMILMNTFVMAAEMQYTGMDTGVKSGIVAHDRGVAEIFPFAKHFFFYSELFFTLFFSAELILRLLEGGRAGIFNFFKTTMNWLDISVVLVGILSIVSASTEDSLPQHTCGRQILLKMVRSACVVSLYALGGLAVLGSASKIALYEVDAQIEARFLSAVIGIDMANDQNCTKVHRFSLQMPLNARVTSLRMNLSDGCDMHSEVKSQAQAEEEFTTSVEKGEAAAMLTAWDSTNYAMSAVLPPLGSARVEIRYGELLKRRNHKVEFQMPVSPGVSVDRLTARVSVHEPESGVRSLTLGTIEGVSPAISIQGVNATAEIAMTNYNASSSQLPRLLRASYDAGDLPEGGLLLTDGLGCIVHLFNPPSLSGSAMPKNIVFVIDVSGSMGGQKLADTKVAFAAIVQMLATGDGADTFAVQTFSNKGSESVWGPSVATTSSVAEAAQFVRSLETIGGTNLHGAYLDGINRAAEGPAGSVPVVVLMTDGQASSGVTDRARIADEVLAANVDVRAKIFALAFGRGADLPLLTGIAIQNGGIAVPIYEGFGDADTQMQNFVENELGEVLLSDVAVNFEGPTVASRTVDGFPLLAAGAEIVVRAQLAPSSRRLNSMTGPSLLRAVTSANAAASSGGSATVEWVADLNLELPPVLFGRECGLSFAHAKIKEIMDFRIASQTLGTSMMSKASSYLTAFMASRSGNATPAPTSEVTQSLVELAREEALQRALDAGLVWPGLTALITVRSASCTQQAAGNSAEICRSGEANGQTGGDGAEEADASAAFRTAAGGAGQPALSMNTQSTSEAASAIRQSGLFKALLLCVSLGVIGV